MVSGFCVALGVGAPSYMLLDIDIDIVCIDLQQVQKSRGMEFWKELQGAGVEVDIRTASFKYGPW